MDSNSPRLPEKRKALNEKTEKLTELKNAVTTLAETFNRINIDSERIRAAREYFENCKFKEADAILKTEDIDNEVTNLKAKKVWLDKEIKETESQLSERAQEYVLKAKLRVTFVEDKDRFKKAEELFEKALDISRNAETIFDYAYYLQGQNQYRQSIELYTEALAIYQKLSQTNPAVYEPYVATTLNNLANLHADTGLYSEAEKEYTEALELYRKLSQTNPAVYESNVAITLHNRAILYGITKRYSEAMQNCTEALELYRKLAKANPDVYESDLADTMKVMELLNKLQ